MDRGNAGPDWNDGMNVMRYLIVDMMLLTNRAIDKGQSIDAHTVRLYQLTSPYIDSDATFRKEWAAIQASGDEALAEHMRAGTLSKRGLKSLEAGHRHLEQGALTRCLFRKGILARAPTPRDHSARDKLRNAAERIPIPDDDATAEA